MFPKFVLLWTDAVMWTLVVAMLVYAGFVQRRAPLKASWLRVFRDAPAFASAIVLALCLVVTLLDSVHFRRALPSSDAAGAPGAAVAYDTRTQSVLDALLSGLIESREATYSRPLSYQSFTLQSLSIDGEVRRAPPRLLHAGRHLKDPAAEWAADITSRVVRGVLLWAGFHAGLSGIRRGSWTGAVRRRIRRSWL
jgi:peptide/nickel transport system permease protein